MTELAVLTIPRRLATPASNPPVIFLPSAKAAERFFEFFTANIRNKNTRRAYHKAVCRFADWCDCMKREARNTKLLAITSWRPSSMNTSHRRASLDEYERVGI